ncbi:PDZ and LIM domain protein 7 [Frankliniella fusca]|uniref:PDZ and LIM domain protein 7 n=1 Tax=Frankliniella fusca TaxID=407009 RepID=A0AAE1LAH9_9NEOP|nr:PDZ and LIM domain protein 7 [Frankliniella fusca]
MLATSLTRSIAVLVLIAERASSARRARYYDDGDPVDAGQPRAQFDRYSYHRRGLDQQADDPFLYDAAPAPLSPPWREHRDGLRPSSDEAFRYRHYAPPAAPLDGDASLAYLGVRPRSGAGPRRQSLADTYRQPSPRRADPGDDQDEVDPRGPPRVRPADGRDYGVRSWDRRYRADPSEDWNHRGGARAERRLESLYSAKLESSMELRQEPRQQDLQQDAQDPRQEAYQAARLPQGPWQEQLQVRRTAQDAQDASPKPLNVQVWLSIDQKSAPVLLQQPAHAPPPAAAPGPGSARLPQTQTQAAGLHRSRQAVRTAPAAPLDPPVSRVTDTPATGKHIVINNYYHHHAHDWLTQRSQDDTEAPTEATTAPETSSPPLTTEAPGAGDEEQQQPVTDPTRDGGEGNGSSTSTDGAAATPSTVPVADGAEPMPASDLETYLGSDLRDADDVRPAAHAGHPARPVLAERSAPVERTAERPANKVAARAHAHAGERTRKRRPGSGSAKDADGAGAASGKGGVTGAEAAAGASRPRGHPGVTPSKRCFSIVTENKVKRYKETPC